MCIRDRYWRHAFPRLAGIATGGSGGRTDSRVALLHPRPSNRCLGSSATSFVRQPSPRPPARPWRPSGGRTGRRITGRREGLGNMVLRPRGLGRSPAQGTAFDGDDATLPSGSFRDALGPDVITTKLLTLNRPRRAGTPQDQFSGRQCPVGSHYPPAGPYLANRCLLYTSRCV